MKKPAITRRQPTPASLEPYPNAPSIEARLELARRSLILAEGALSALVADEGAFDPHHYVEAVRDAVIAAQEENFWLTKLPAKTLARRAPDDDQAARPRA